MNNNLNWNLDILYKGFDDQKYKDDYKELEKVIKEIKENAKNIGDDKVKYIEDYLKREIKSEELISELYMYASLRLSADVNDSVALEEMDKMDYMMQDTVEAAVVFKNLIRDVDVLKLAKMSALIEEHKFLLLKMKELAKHMLSDKEEILANKLEMVGSSSWSLLQTKLISNLKIKVKGFKNKMNLSEVRNLAYDKDPEVRKNAYKAELNAYKQIDISVAMALNNIKREVNILTKMRGYEDGLDFTLKQENITKETLNALIDALKEEQVNFRRYFKLKAKALGYEKGLPFYDLFAPIGSFTSTYTYEEASKKVLDAYKSFSMPLYEMGKEAFENRWIDVMPKNGKEGGAFCASLDNHDESRVLTNFTGSLGDIQTLAHELGHAYHGRISRRNSILNRNYPMQLAETASIFCQTILSKLMIEEIEDKKEKLSAVEVSLQEDSQCVVDILSRFLFEKMVLDTKVEIPLSSEDFCKMMLKAQKETYGDGLDKRYMHKYMWLCKSHYYSADYNFYNWSYAFGLLYAKGLYKKYLENKEEFVSKYDEMLKATSIMSTEDVAKTMGIDITKKEFWISSLKFIEEDIDLYEKLLKETKMI